MRQVTQEEFYATIGPRDVHPHIVTPWPFVSIWRTPTREVLGRSEIYFPEGSALFKTRYFLP